MKVHGGWWRISAGMQRRKRPMILNKTCIPDGPQRRTTESSESSDPPGLGDQRGKPPRKRKDSLMPFVGSNPVTVKENWDHAGCWRRIEP